MNNKCKNFLMPLTLNNLQCNLKNVNFSYGYKHIFSVTSGFETESAAKAEMVKLINYWKSPSFYADIDSYFNGDNIKHDYQQITGLFNIINNNFNSNLEIDSLTVSRFISHLSEVTIKIKGQSDVILKSTTSQKTKRKITDIENKYEIINQNNSRLLNNVNEYAHKNFTNATSYFQINPAKRTYFSFSSYHIDNKLYWNINYTNAYFIQNFNFKDNIHIDILDESLNDFIILNKIHNLNNVTITVPVLTDGIFSKFGRSN